MNRVVAVAVLVFAAAPCVAGHGYPFPQDYGGEVWYRNILFRKR
jgi:hypothetical protein